MYHAFDFLGNKLLFDVESSSLHMIDDVAFDAATDEKEARQKHGALAIEAIEELNALRACGALDAAEPEPPITLERPVKAMCLHVAHDCDLACAYCFADGGRFLGESSLLSLETGRRALEWLVESSKGRDILEVDFFGGEPMLNFSVVKDLVRYGRVLERTHKKSISFTLTTNGLALTDEIEGFLNQEISNVVLSLDGRKGVHDHARKTLSGDGSYDIVKDKIVSLAAKREELGLEYYVRGTFTAFNLDFSKDALALFDLGVRRISLEPVVLPETHPMAIRQEHVPGLLKEYDALARAYMERRANGEDIHFFHFYADLSGGPCLAKRVSGCGAGNEYAAVTPEGDIYPCHQFVGEMDFKLGDVFSGELDRPLRETLVGTTLYSKPGCRACWAKYLCGGGCMAAAKKLTGSLNSPDEIACALQKKRMECALGIFALESGR